MAKLYKVRYEFIQDSVEGAYRQEILKIDVEDYQDKGETKKRYTLRTETGWCLNSLDELENIFTTIKTKTDS